MFVNAHVNEVRTDLVRYDIVDTEFKDTVEVPNRGEEIGVLVWRVDIGMYILAAYQPRNLPVIPNFVRAISQFKVQPALEYNLRYNPYYKEHENEINQYLLLL
jgi:hypothetical protein